MCDRMGISQSNLTFTFFGFFWGNSKEVTFPMALLHYVSFANCSGLGGLRRLASNEGGVSQTLGINLWCLPLVVSPKSGQFPFKDLKSKPELKKVSPSDLPHDPKKKKKHLTDLASPAMALCRAPYMMLVQPMSGISILSHCLKSSTFNHLKLSTI